jgi:hypothetical protein
VISPVVRFERDGFETIIARRAEPAMVPRIEIKLALMPCLNLAVQVFQFGPVFVKFIGRVFSPQSYGLCMAKLKRQARPVSKTDMDTPSIAEESRDGKSVEAELGTSDILRIQITSGLRIFIVFSGFEVVNPEFVVEEVPLEIVGASNPTLLSQGSVSNDIASSIDSERNSLLVFASGGP